MSRHPPAVLRLATLLESHRKFDEALTLAQNAVKSNPKDPVLHLALSSAWWGKHETTQAEAELKEAVRLAPDALGPVRTLLEFYTDTGRTKLARETLDNFLGKFKLPDVDRELFRGDMLVRIGSRKEAKAAYQKAAELAKDDPPVAMRLAEFLLRSSDPADDADGEKLLRRLMPQYDPARRRLAEVLVARGGEAEWEEAQKLLEQSAGDPIAAVDRFTEVRSLIRRGGPQNLDKAAAICQELLAQASLPPPAVYVMLAKVRELQGNVDDARKAYLALVSRANPPAAQLAIYIAFLLRHGPAAEADQRLKQLEKLAPEDLVAIELRAGWLRDQKRTAEIEPLVEGHAQKLLAQLDKENVAQEAQLARAVGDLYRRIELYSAAERWYRRLLILAGDTYEPLVGSLAKQGRIQEAVALCQDAGKNDESVRPALLVAQVLSSGRATTQDMNAAEPYLKKTLESHQDQPDFLNCLAGIRVLQGRPKDAIELYRQILKLQPRNIAVLNNLATILGEQAEPECRQEALECVERAIELAGPLSSLLDTKGMIFVYDGKPERAIGPLQAAVQSPSPDPRYGFHLAVACCRLGQLERARTALRQARDADLEHQLLTNKDRQLLADLEKQLAL
jgi:tetratricopeptide (TPR) repeat protein